jgi:uncharacterized RDD family membrane protein YckC
MLRPKAVRTGHFSGALEHFGPESVRIALVFGGISGTGRFRERGDMDGCPHHPDRTQEIVRCAECLRGFCRDCVQPHEHCYYCRGCRRQNAPSPTFGGHDLPPSTPGPITPSTRPQAAAAAIPDATREIPPAGLFARFLAFAIDALIVGVGVSLVVSLVPESHSTLILGLMVALPILYEALFVQETGQTLGKSLLGLRIVSADGAPASDAQAWGRGTMKIAQLMCCGLTLLTATLASSRRGLHDLAAGTSVVKAADIADTRTRI